MGQWFRLLRLASPFCEFPFEYITRSFGTAALLVLPRRSLFRQNARVSDPTRIEQHLLEGEARLEMGEAEVLSTCVEI